MDRRIHDDQVYDLVGIGFGPSNLALAIALQECSEAQDSALRYKFVEKQAAFAWHSSLLLPGSQLQVSPLKDLATMRDPTSSYTFFNYLHQQGRLVAYINRGVSIPSRQEWSAYLTWAAKRLDGVVTYNESVVSVEPERQSPMDASIQLLRDTMRNNDTQEIRFMFTRNFTVGIGGVPNLPPALSELYQSQRQGSPSPVVHSGTYLPGLKLIRPTLQEKEKLLTASSTSGNTSSSSPSQLKLAVIGGGQSAAEMSLHLRKTFPNADVRLIFRASALAPSDDSAFINAAAFDPDRTDSFWCGSEKDRQMWRTEFGRTNYSVVRSDVLNEIYNNLYNQQLDLEMPSDDDSSSSSSSSASLSNGKLTLEANKQISKAELNESSQVILTLSSTIQGEGATERTDTFDAVFLGTGFQRRPKALGLLQPLGPYFPLLDEQSEQHKADLGYGDEAETKEAIASTIESGDESAVERLRHRVRGITRDYRLVSYLSDAFAAADSAAAACASSSRRSSSNSAGSGSSSPSRESDAATASSHTSDDSTLAGSQGGHGDGCEDQGSVAAFEPSIYFLGGNEETHGLADSLFSIVAHRAGELCQSIIERHSTQVVKTSTSQLKRSQRFNNEAEAEAREKVSDGVPISTTTTPLSSFNKTSVASPFTMVKEKMQRLHV